MEQSNQGALNKEDYKQILIKAVMATVAAAIPVLTAQLGLANFGSYQPAVSVVIFLLGYVGQRLNQGK